MLPRALNRGPNPASPAAAATLHRLRRARRLPTASVAFFWSVETRHACRRFLAFLTSLFFLAVRSSRQFNSAVRKPTIARYVKGSEGNELSYDLLSMWQRQMQNPSFEHKK